MSDAGSLTEVERDDRRQKADAGPNLIGLYLQDIRERVSRRSREKGSEGATEMGAG
jgi:hypothetical protein